MKDFAKSYEQKSWEFAVAEHARMQNWLKNFTHEKTTQYAQSRIEALEAEYPQLTKGA